MSSRRRTGSGSEESENEARSDNESSESEGEQEVPEKQENKLSTSESNATEKKVETKPVARRQESRKEKRDPSHVPRMGGFFLHDERDPEPIGSSSSKGNDNVHSESHRREKPQRKKASDDAWTHDKFQDIDDVKPSRSKTTTPVKSNAGSKGAGSRPTPEPKSSESHVRNDKNDRNVDSTKKTATTIAKHEIVESTVKATSVPTSASKTDKAQIKTVVRAESPPAVSLTVTPPVSDHKPRKEKEHNNSREPREHREPRGPPKEQFNHNNNNSKGGRGHSDTRDHNNRESEHNKPSQRGPPREYREYHSTQVQQQPEHQQPEIQQSKPRGSTPPRLNAHTSAQRSTQERPLRERPNRNQGDAHKLNVNNDVKLANKLKNAVGVPTTPVNNNAATEHQPSKPHQDWKGSNKSGDVRQHQAQVSNSTSAAVSITPNVVATPNVVTSTPSKNPPGLDMPQLKATARAFEPTPSPSNVNKANSDSNLYAMNSETTASAPTYNVAPQPQFTYPEYVPVSSNGKYKNDRNLQPHNSMYGTEYGAAISPRDTNAYSAQPGAYGVISTQDLALDAYGNAVPVMYSGYPSTVYPDTGVYGEPVAYTDGSVMYSDNSGMYADPMAYGGGMISDGSGTVWYSTPSELPPSGTIYYPPPPPVTSPVGTYYASGMDSTNH